jgi:peptidyl-prolyl cis-trans isomerase SurA
VPEVSPTASSPAVRSPFRRSTSLGFALLPLSLLGLTLAGGCNRPHQPDVVATVNGHPIDQATLERYYHSNIGNNPQQPSPVQSQIAHLEILRQLIDNEIQQQRAAKLNLVATDEEVDAKLAEIKAPYTQEEFNRQLKAKNMTMDDLKRQIRQGLTSEKLMNKEINSKINITDADISNYYNANKSLFNLVEPEYHLAEIIVSAVPTQPGNMQVARGNTDAEAKKKIEALHTRLESGDDFGALASQFSEQSSTASSGGDMGRLTESQLRQDSAVFAAISKLRPGQMTDVVPLYDQSHKANGYAIYKLLDKEAAGQYELNDPRVQQTIRGQLRDSRSQLLRNAYDEMLRDQAHVENYYAEGIFKKGAQ